MRDQRHQPAVITDAQRVHFAALISAVGADNIDLRAPVRGLCGICGLPIAAEQRGRDYEPSLTGRAHLVCVRTLERQQEFQRLVRQEMRAGFAAALGRDVFAETAPTPEQEHSSGIVPELKLP